MKFPAHNDSWNPPTSYCEGKASYATKAKAMTVIKRRQLRARKWFFGSNERRREVARLAPYRCPRCHHWHIGSNRT